MEMNGIVGEEEAVKLRVLAIEHSRSDIDLLRECLRPNGCKPHIELRCCSDLDDFQVAMSEHTSDVILVDLDLCESSGENTLRQIQAIAGNLPVVFLSDQEHHPNVECLVEHGAQECVSKRNLSAELLRHSFCHAIERKRLLDQVTDLSIGLTRLDRMDSIGRIASGLAHELKHPLTSLTLAIDYFNARVSPDDQSSIKRINTMRRSLHRANLLVGSLLNFASDEPFDPKPIELGRLFRETIDLLETDLESNGARIDCDLDPALPEFVLDRNRMEQVLINLIRNGIQATNSSPEQPRISIRAKRSTGGVLISIEDNGCGISEEESRRVFEPFFTTKQRGEGTGLGLTVSKEIVELHGGSLELKARQPAHSGCIAEIFLPS